MRWIAALAALLLASPAWGQTVDPLHAAVADYAGYQSDVSTLLDAPIDSQGALDAMLDLAASRDPGRVARGWVAYGALVAAQSPAFVRGVRRRVSAAGRAAVLRLLRRDLGYARRRPPGSGEAVRLILIAARADGERLGVSGARYGDVAQGIEFSGWALPPDELRAEHEARRRRYDDRPLPAAFLPRVRVAPLAADPLRDVRAFGGASFWDALSGRRAVAAPAAPPGERASRTQTLDRMLTLAALFIVEASAQERAYVASLIDDAPVRECLELEQLQYRQCASVAHFAYEGAYCLARHGLSAPGACFAAITQ